MFHLYNTKTPKNLLFGCSQSVVIAKSGGVFNVSWYIGNLGQKSQREVMKLSEEQIGDLGGANLEPSHFTTNLSFYKNPLPRPPLLPKFP